VLGKVGPRQTGKIELYDDGRYLTVTGHHLAGTPMQIEDRRDELPRWHAELFPPAPAPDHDPHGSPPDADKAALLDRARRAANGAKFGALYDRGDVRGYGSPSEADAALCLMLAFWTGRDAGRMDRLFRGSALMRAKWDARRGRETYGARTVAAAIAKCTDTYTPRARPCNPPC
jgi:putative DNA primase/helicase